MSVNDHIDPLLTDFARMNHPGFAILIDAPWGAGKTFVIDRWLAGRKNLSVSLYGVRSRDEIDRAILLARLATIDNGASRALASLVSAGVEGAASYFKIKNSLKVTDLAQAGLPNILVFDDLERAEMPMTQLLGALNRFVEHEKKNVILIANQKELERQKDYQVAREKVIGRIITIKPDVKAALEKFILLVECDKTRRFLLSKTNIIVSVFDTTGSQNLRLLRQSLLEFSHLHKRLSDQFLKNDEGMKSLLATFLALSIAFHGGDLSAQEVEMISPALVARFPRLFITTEYTEDNTKKSAKEIEESNRAQKVVDFLKRWDGHSYVALGDTMIISPKLIKLLIIKGYASDSVINCELKKSFAFMLEKGVEPAWQTLWWWRQREESVAQQALVQVEQQLADKEIIEPFEILHVAGILLGLAKEKIRGDSLASVKDELVNYILDLETLGLLVGDAVRLRDYKRQEDAYGLGFAQRETEEFAIVQDTLEQAMERHFWKHSKAREEEMLQMCRDAPNDFAQSIDNAGRPNNIPNYAYLPIFSDFDPVKFAETVFSLDSRSANTVLEPFRSRIVRLEAQNRTAPGNVRDERSWLIKVKDEGIRIASESKPFRAGQIRSVLKWNLDFLESEEDLPSSENSSGLAEHNIDLDLRNMQND